MPRLAAIEEKRLSAYGPGGVAVPAVPLDEHFADPGDIQMPTDCRSWQRHVVDARDASAIDANKVRMAAAIVLGVPHFEPPNVIPKLGSQDQFGLGQIGQIAKDGGFIEPQRYKLISQLRVGLGSAGPF